MDFLKRVFGGGEQKSEQTREEHDIRVATCALLLEIANSDSEFSDAERDQILQILQSEYGIAEEEALALTETAAEALAGSVDTWKFTNQINENYSVAEKLRVVELIWKVVYADGRLDGHEDYLVHKLARLLRLQHKQLIATKMQVLQEQRDQGADDG